MSGRRLAHVAAEHLTLARQEPTKRARVLRLAELGYGLAAIGRALGLSPRGVRWHEPPAKGRRWRLPSSTIEAVVAERRGRRAA